MLTKNLQVTILNRSDLKEEFTDQNPELHDMNLYDIMKCIDLTSPSLIDKSFKSDMVLFIDENFNTKILKFRYGNPT